LQENPTFEAGARTLALAKLAGGHIEEAKQEYGKLESMSPRGASMAAAALQIWRSTRGVCRMRWVS